MAVQAADGCSITVEKDAFECDGCDSGAHIACDAVKLVDERINQGGDKVSNTIAKWCFA